VKVGTVGIGITFVFDADTIVAFIKVDAGAVPVIDEASHAVACETRRKVDAVLVLVTIMKSVCTFVNVGAVSITIASESFNAFASEASVNVATGGIECAIMSSLLTFIDIETSFVAFTGSGVAFMTFAPEYSGFVVTVGVHTAVISEEKAFIDVLAVVGFSGPTESDCTVADVASDGVVAISIDVAVV
jgi:hypothetical protein